MRNREFESARRALRAELARSAEEELLGEIDFSTGAQVQVAWYRERGRPRVLSVWLYHRDGDGRLRPDPKRGLRFHLNEIPALARILTRALQDVDRFVRRQEQP